MRMLKRPVIQPKMDPAAAPVLKSITEDAREVRQLQEEIAVVAERRRRRMVQAKGFRGVTLRLIGESANLSPQSVHEQLGKAHVGGGE